MINNHSFSLKQQVRHKRFHSREGTIIGLTNYQTISTLPSSSEEEGNEPWYIVSWWDGNTNKTQISAVSEQDIR